MAFKTPWLPVYPDLTTLERAGKVTRLTINLPTDDAKTIMSVAVNPSIFSLICQTALKAAADHVRTNSLSYTDSSRFVERICKRAIGCVVEETASSDVTSRASSVHPGVTNPAKESASSGSEAPRGGSEGRGRGRNGNGNGGGTGRGK